MSASRRIALGASGLFVLLAVAYMFSVGLRASYSAAITGDEPFYLLTTQSLIDDRNLDLREQYERESYESFFDHPDGLWKQSSPDEKGRILSPHQPGLSVLLIPGFRLGGLHGAQAELLLIAAATFALAFVLAAKEAGRPGIAWLVTATVGLSAPAFVYSTEIYPEIPAGFVLVAAVLGLRSARGRWRLLAAVAAVTGLAWLGMKYLPIAGVLAVGYLLSASGRERAAFLGLASVSGAAYVGAHLAWFGSLTPYSGNAVYQGASTATVLGDHFAFTQRVYRLWGLFLDRRFGIGHWVPITLLVLPALPLLTRTKQGRLAVSLIGTQVLVATFLAVTMMGWSFPGRHIIVVLPLFPLAITVLIVRLPSFLAPFWAALGVWSLAITLAFVAAGRAGEITTAVNPFELRSPSFTTFAAAFPDYRWWGAETLVLNGAWLAFLVGALVATARLAIRGSRRANPAVQDVAAQFSTGIRPTQASTTYPVKRAPARIGAMRTTPMAAR